MRDTYHAQRSWKTKAIRAQTDLEANLDWFAAQGRTEGRRARRDSDGLTDEQIATARFVAFDGALQKHAYHVRNGHALAMDEREARIAFESGWNEVWNYGR